jgi:hypothetical protein
MLYTAAKKGDVTAMLNILKYRRRDVYNIHPDEDKPTQPANYFLNVTLQDKIKRLERLGLPVPVIESDYEIVDASDDGNHS